MATYAAVGNMHTAQRIISAENRFLDGLMSAASITRDEAVKV
jgi:hypothetical protein